MSDLLKLAERLEAATGPDRELDIHIDCAAFGNGPITDDQARSFAQLDDEILDTRFYTASLDAAMTLVPEGRAKYVADDEHGCHACVWDRGSPQKRGASGGCKDAATPALALCAAALRARAAQ